jgi:hypothetical protein
MILFYISLIIIFIGSILLSYNIGKINNKCSQDILDEDKIIEQRPTKIFKKMFNNSDLWNALE